MKDIKLNTGLKKAWYVLCQIFFVLGGSLIFWIIAIVLYYQDKEKPKKKNILNKTYQKLIFVYGSIVIGLSILTLVIALIAWTIMNILF